MTLKQQENADKQSVIIQEASRKMEKETVGYMASIFSKREKQTVVKHSVLDKATPAASIDLIPGWLYYTVTLGLFVVNVGAAFGIDDVEIVTGFIGSIANSIINYFFPGFFFVMVA